ncbi:iron transporter [Vibrio tarriae]|nr:iron transporter [Vibrio tarriae]
MVAVVVFESSGMRCQPLRRALAISKQIGSVDGKYMGFRSIRVASSC